MNTQSVLHKYIILVKWEKERIIYNSSFYSWILLNLFWQVPQYGTPPPSIKMKKLLSPSINFWRTIMFLPIVHGWWRGYDTMITPPKFWNFLSHHPTILQKSLNSIHLETKNILNLLFISKMFYPLLSIQH